MFDWRQINANPTLSLSSADPAAQFGFEGLVYESFGAPFSDGDYCRIGGQIAMRQFMLEQAIECLGLAFLAGEVGDIEGTIRSDSLIIHQPNRTLNLAATWSSISSLDRHLAI